MTGYGRRGRAPCGHDGEHIFGSYVRCGSGCDAVARPGVDPVVGDPHLDAFGRTYDLAAARNGAPWTMIDWPTKVPSTWPGFTHNVTVAWTPEEVRARAYGNGHAQAMTGLRNHRSQTTAQLLHAGLCGNVESLPNKLLAMHTDDVVDYFHKALRMTKTHYYTCLIVAPEEALRYLTAGGPGSVLNELYNQVPAGIAIQVMATDDGAPMAPGTSAVLVPVSDVVFHDQSTPPHVVSVTPIGGKVNVAMSQTVRIHTLDYSKCVRVEGLA